MCKSENSNHHVIEKRVVGLCICKDGWRGLPYVIISVLILESSFQISGLVSSNQTTPWVSKMSYQPVSVALCLLAVMEDVSDLWSSKKGQFWLVVDYIFFFLVQPENFNLISPFVENVWLWLFSILCSSQCSDSLQRFSVVGEQISEVGHCQYCSLRVLHGCAGVTTTN